jgi:hypothetical protein
VLRAPLADLAVNTLILLVAVLAGLIAGLTRAWVHKIGLHIPDLHLVGLVPVAFLLQALAFYLPGLRSSLPIQWVSFSLVTSQALLLVFAWANRRLMGFWPLGLGLLLNLTVILINGGMMPISPETVTQLMPNAATNTWSIGTRLGVTKDLVIPEAQTTFAFLSDRFILPNWINQNPVGNAAAAFSIGDVFIASGAFWVIWSFGRPTEAT